jgi:hypothetical protein
VAPAGRGSGGASVVERGEPTLILRPSGRTERAWRFQEPAGSLLARVCCDLLGSWRC